MSDRSQPTLNLHELASIARAFFVPTGEGKSNVARVVSRK
jgi:hypothetical protein